MATIAACRPGVTCFATIRFDVGLHPDHLLAFVISWRLNSKRMGVIKKDPFIQGLCTLQVDSVEKLKAMLPLFHKDLKDHRKEIFIHAFQIAKPPTQRTLDFETASAIIRLFLSSHVHAEKFITFLRDQTSYKVLTRDQWACAYDLISTLSPTLDDYDADGAWPSMMDEYYEWIRSGHGAEAEGAPSSV